MSPVITADTGPLCLVFSYQLWGEAQGHLRVLLRDAQDEDTVLWALKDDQSFVWKEGRTILPRSPKDFQVRLRLFLVSAQSIGELYQRFSRRHEQLMFS